MSYLPQVQQSPTAREEYHSLVGSPSERSLVTIKKARKQIEADAQLLANRIALLKQEELKAWKKIEETKKKSQEVLMLKTKNEEKQALKLSQVMGNDNKLKDTQSQSAELRRKKKLDRKQLLEAIYQQKHQDMLEIRNQKKINENKKNEFKNKIMQANYSKSQTIKQQEALKVLKIQEMQEAKLRKYKEDREKVVMAEEERRRQREVEVMNLEKIEMELIQKLQQTQRIQKNAYDELENVLAKPLSTFSSQVMQKSPSTTRLPGTVRISPKGMSWGHNQEADAQRVHTSKSISD